MKARMARRVTFSAGHRFWDARLSEAENRRLFGDRASLHNHGHDYVFELVVEGEVDEATAMLVNIRRVNDLLQERVVRRLGMKSLNDQIEPFGTVPPTLENLLEHLRMDLAPDGELTLDGKAIAVPAMRLEESPRLAAALEWTSQGTKMTLIRTYEFSASHRLWSDAFDDETNQRLYGKDTNPAGHGHNFLMEVVVSGEPDPRTGMMVDLDELDQAVKTLVVDRYDHKNLNVDVPELQGKLTTCEIVVHEIFRALEGRIPATLEGIRLWESPRNCFEMKRDGAG